MRHRLQIALVMTAWVAVAAERPTVGLLTAFPSDVSPAVRNEFRRETERAIQTAGVDLVWRDLGESQSEESFDRLVVLRFKSDCSSRPAQTRPLAFPLGLTHVSDGQVLPFVELDCQRVQEAMDAGGWRTRSRPPALMLGRALGRVAAHEIHHVLTGSGAHDQEGLMKRSFDRRDLCGSELSFSGTSVRRLRVSVGTATTQTARRAKASTDD